MKKTLLSLLLALSALAVSADTRRVNYGGYRIGSSDVATDETRVSDLPVLIQPSGQGSSKKFAASKVNGQKIVKWWAYNSKSTVPATHTTPAHVAYNNSQDVAGSVYSMDWTYNTFAYSSAYLVVDYDWIKYNLSYNANGGSGSLPSSRSNIIYTNEVVVASDSLPARTGYTWSGWTNNLTTTVWQGGETVTGESLGLRSIVDGSNVVLYAKWTAKTCTVTFDQQSGTGGSASVTATYGAAMPSITLPTRTGYTFGGYFTETNGSGTQYYTAAGKSARAWDKTAATTLYAKWTVNQYDLTLSLGAHVTKIYYKINGAANWTAITTKTTLSVNYASTWYGYAEASPGYTAYYPDSGNPYSQPKDARAESLTFAARANTYTVTLDMQSGTGGSASVTATYGAAMPSITMPTRTGYTFDGYYTIKNGGGVKYYNADGSSVKEWDIDSSNPVLYANWTPVTYTVTLDRQRGSGGDSSAIVTYDADMPQVKVPERTGYDFAGYYTDVNGGGTQYYASNGTSARKWDMTAATTLYAKWTANAYEVSFDKNSAEAAGNMQNEDFDYGVEKALTSNAFTRTGYTFAGWAKSADGQVEYTDGQIVSNLTTAASAVVPLFAAWTPIEYTIAFNGNEADNPDAMAGDSIPVAYDAVVTLPESKFVKQGRSFKAWQLDDVTYDVGDSVSNLTTEAGATVIFSAVWSELRYVAFDGNGADDAGAMIDDVMTFDGIETKALVPNKFEKTGYTFGGWATNETDAAALNAAYTDGADVVSTNLWMAAGETNIFYAVWQTNTYTVVFKRNGGNGTMDPQTFVYDQPQQLNSYGFDANLNFAGWATNSTGEIVFANNETVVNLTAEANGTVTLYAVWDNGDLSKAMHCDNLYWKPDGSGDYGQWIPVVGPNEGYNPSGSVVSNEIGSALNTSASYKLKPLSALQTAGLLSFRYKMSNTERNNQLVVQIVDVETNLVASTEWQQFGPVNIASNAEVQIRYNCTIVGSLAEPKRHSVWIDQMTWVPGGAEPTDADMPTINGFTAKDGGFTLSVDGGNISDLFSYQILATNELVKGDWPVRTNLTADALKEGFDIVPEAGEPKMFYKVKVVPKQ